MREYIEYGQVLYAPSIRIDDDWLKVSALYYDKVNRIVPEGIEEEHSEVAKEFNDEIDFIRNLKPRHQERIEKDFLTFALSFLSKHEERERINDILGEELEGGAIGIHSGKATGELIDKLSKLGLVVKRGDGWNDFDANTGTMYMGFLAKEMARFENLPIATSSPVFHNAVDFLADTQSDTSFKLAAMVIDGYAPRDIKSIKPKKIIEFREKYKAEREAFYSQINALTSDLSQVKSEKALQNILIHRKKRIDSTISDIQKAGKGLNIPIVKGLFSVIFTLGKSDSVGAITSSLDTIGVAIDSVKNDKAISYVLALNEQLDKETLANQLINRKIIF
jgi:hypothetical protein